ncbi:hypothetical protein DMENIID0001_102710 [Sergentomyia squamirostris]
MGDEKIFSDDKMWPDDLKKREEQWQKNGGSPGKQFDRKPPSPSEPHPSSRGRRRSRSRSRGYSPDRFRRRDDDFDFRRRGMRRSPERRGGGARRERSRENRLRNRSTSRGRRDRSLSRGRNRRDWSPKGRRSPPIRRPATPQAPPPPSLGQAPPPYIPQPLYADQYGYSAGVPPSYQGIPQQFAGYDFPGQAPQPYVPPYPPPPPPVLLQQGDDFNSGVWGVPSAMGQQQSMQGQMAHPVHESEEDKSKREAAVAQEMKNQRATLKKQREDYQRRAGALTRELKILKEQRNKLAAVNQPHSPTTRNFLKENDRLQSQIQNKLGTIENVIDMLSGIIGTEKTPSPPMSGSKAKGKAGKESDSDESEPEKLKNKVIQSMKKSKMETAAPQPVLSRDKLIDPSKKINYVFYDPEMHWCPVCNVFPKTAKDYLNHLQTKEHLALIKSQESPWHDNQQMDEFPNFPDAPTKRTPIRGLQFFTPAPAWYCKLCSIWMGDLHCASSHLKSKTHADNYNAYSEQNPHFDMDWIADRQKAYDLQREKVVSGKKSPLTHMIPMQTDEVDLEKRTKKKKKKSEGRKEKKKRKRGKRKRESSSSSSSESSSGSESDSDKKEAPLQDAAFEEIPSNSIRVSMRNMTKLPIPDTETAVGKWTMVQPAQIAQTPFAPPAPSISTEAKKRDELIISQWTPGPVISESERKLLDDLKGKLKKKTETEGQQEEKRRSRDRTSPVERRYRRRSRGRYSRSRSRSPYYSRHGRRRSSSRGRRSNSRGRRVIEKAVVNYPPEPKRPPEKKSKLKNDGNGERKKSPPKKKIPTTGKLPFIGRMPVFKKQVTADDAAKKGTETEESSNQNAAASKPLSKTDAIISQSGSMDDELMPDPAQFMVLIGGHPPPPPRQEMEKSEEVLPPGIDESEADLVPKPISDAPRPRKGPLPKDFQEALDLIFPDPEKKREAEEKAKIEDSNKEPVDMECLTEGDDANIEVRGDDGSQQELYAGYPAAAGFTGAPGYVVFDSSAESPAIVPPPPPIDMDNSADNSIPQVEMIIEENKESTSTINNKIDLDDLALLGIDADDMAAQCM